MIRGPINSQKY